MKKTVKNFLLSIVFVLVFVFVVACNSGNNDNKDKNEPATQSGNSVSVDGGNGFDGEWDPIG